MAPKQPASPATPIPPRTDMSVAPYLTHIVTHHGQVTLIPPQNQGRVRKNKRARGVNVAQTEQASVEAAPSRSVASLGSTTPQSRRRRKSRMNVGITDSSVPDQGPLQATTSDLRTPILRLSPPPTYDSLHSEAAASPVNDVISLASSSPSSDDFEDLTELDNESQWELDRMAGFTLEERVHRELHRLQAAMGRSMRPAHAESSYSILHRVTPSRSCETLSEPSSPPPPPPKDLPNTPDSTEYSSSISSSLVHPKPPESTPRVPYRRHKPRSPHIPLKYILQHASETETKSSLEDWDILEPVRESGYLTRSRPPPVSLLETGTPFPPRISNRGAEVSPPNFTFQAVAPRTPVPTEHRGALSGKPAMSPRNATISPSNLDSLGVGSRDTISPRRPSRNERERQVESVSDNGFNPAAIHNRPLPVPPVSPDVQHSAALSSATETSSVSAFSPESYANRFTVLPDPRPSNDHIPEFMSLLAAPLPPISIRDRVTRFESMRDRPVPPPPVDFLSKARAKRRPPPPPPSAYRFEVASLGTSDPARSLDAAAKNADRDGIEVQSSRFTNVPPDSELPPVSPPENHDISPFLPHSPTFGNGGQIPTTDSSGTSPPVLDDINGNRPRIQVSARESNIATNLSSNMGYSENVAARLELLSAPRLVPQDRSVAEPRRRPSLPGGSESPPGFRPSAPPTTLNGGPEEGLGPYTDLDVLLSRLDDATSGNRYEDLLIVSELLGPAQPQSMPSQIVGDLPLGRIEVVRRRKLQDGRVKLKLSLLGVMVDRCGVCLSQFKDAEWAVLLPCIHPFHSTCLQSWMTRSHTCPLCRVTLDIA